MWEILLFNQLGMFNSYSMQYEEYLTVQLSTKLEKEIKRIKNNITVIL